MSEVDRFIGHRLRALRRQRGLLIEQLADALLIDSVELSKVECGSVRVTADDLLSICRERQVAPAEVFEGILPPDPPDPPD